MDGAAPLPEPVNALGRSLFREVAAQFLQHNSLYADNPSILAYQFRVFDKHLGGLPFDDVGRESLEGFFAARRQAGTKATTCNRNRCALHVFYKWAVDRGLCAENPIDRIPKFKERPRQGISLTPQEVASLIMAASPHLKCYLLALLWTGGRRTETVRLKWRWFNPEARSITFVREDTKSRKTRTVPVPEPLYRALLALPRGAPDSPIFTYEGRPVKDMKGALHAACRRAGLPRIGWHVLRRTYATWASENGMPLQMLQDLLGHASPVTTKKYVVPSDTFLRTAERYLQAPGSQGQKILPDPS